MSRKRKQYSPEFKAKVAVAAIKNEETIAELSAKYQVHPTMINNWKKALLEGASDLFDKGQKSKKNHEATLDKLYRKIGQLEVENDFLSKGLDL
ncbi:IS3 family transposase [Desulfatiferula olefinivorans]